MFVLFNSFPVKCRHDDSLLNFSDWYGSFSISALWKRSPVIPVTEMLSSASAALLLIMRVYGTEYRVERWKHNAIKLNYILDKSNNTSYTFLPRITELFILCHKNLRYMYS